MNEFINLLKDEIFEETSIELLTPTTKFRDLEEWDSLSSMILIGLADSEFNKQLTGEDIASAITIQDLYNLIKN